jgi:hypothetical protein
MQLIYVRFLVVSVCVLSCIGMDGTPIFLQLDRTFFVVEKTPNLVHKVVLNVVLIMNLQIVTKLLHTSVLVIP